MKIIILTIPLFFAAVFMHAQERDATIIGKILSEGNALNYASIIIMGTSKGDVSNSEGEYSITGIRPGKYRVKVSALGYKEIEKNITLQKNKVLQLNFNLQAENVSLEEVVITGTLKEIRKLDSPVPVSVISSKLFKRNPTSNVLDALYMVNGITPQVNCNACNTADIGINGMPGPYSMVLIDGMPIVSSLSSVYGFSGISNSIINRVEIVKGPASSLYGSEAMGGVINIITKDAANAPRFFLDYSGSTWGELTGNMGFSAQVNKNISTLFNVDGYFFNTEKDQDKDGFMDKTLQKRVSVFNKWDFKQKYNKMASISLRYYNENRRGGEIGWNKQHRDFTDFETYNDNPNSEDYNADYVLPNGYTIYNEKYAKGFRTPKFLSEEEKQAWKDEVRAVNPNAEFADDMKYMESVWTSRFEVIGKYELPIEENITLHGSYNRHNQNSDYASELFRANQETAFGQAYWDRKTGDHNLLTGFSYRYVWYKDNTIASNNGKSPFITHMPGIFVQDLWTLNSKTNLLMGYRFDYDVTESESGSHKNPVHSPRVALKYAPNEKNILRGSVGTGYRVVNIFNEEHRALSGQYKAQFGEELKPEVSLSGTLDYEGRVPTENFGLTYNLGLYYTHFFNKIYPYRNDADRTLTYYNVDGKEYARNLGVSLDIALTFQFPLLINAGVSYNQAELFEFERDEDGEKTSENIEKNRFEYSPRWSGVFNLSYDLIPQLTWDITGEWKGPVLLPTQGEMDTFDEDGNVIGSEEDPRSEFSPWFAKVNTQFTYRINKQLQVYAGVKNIFNYVAKNLYVNLEDPFDDRSEVYGGLQFDTEYNYTPQQGVTGYAGITYSF